MLNNIDLQSLIYDFFGGNEVSNDTILDKIIAFSAVDQEGILFAEGSDVTSEILLLDKFVLHP